MTLALLCGLIDAKQSLMHNFDIKETAAFIKSKMDEGIPIAHVGKYHGQYQFLGRLSQPITMLNGETKTLLEFSASHPTALFISYQHAHKNRLPEGAKICFSHKYRGKTVLVWELEKRLP